jgi:hypothetical protein
LHSTNDISGSLRRPFWHDSLSRQYFEVKNNMRHIFLAIALTASLSISPAFADQGTNKPAVSDPDQAIKCRKVEVTGSLLKKGKVCRTIAEWKKIQENGNRVARAVVEEGAKPTN